MLITVEPSASDEDLFEQVILSVVRFADDDAFKKDIKSRHKVRYYGSIGAVDVKHWFQCTA